MDPRPVVRLELELDRGLEPISGRVRTADNPTQSFSGVLDLINLLDHARGGELAPEQRDRLHQEE